MSKTALAALGTAVFAAMTALTIAFSSGQPAKADNTHGGAGETITQSAAPTELQTPSAAPTVKATPFGG